MLHICMNIMVSLQWYPYSFFLHNIIVEMDEMIIDTVEVDLLALTSLGNHTPNWDQSKRKKMTIVRVSLYIAIPIIVAFFTYTTAYNQCYVFCDNK